MALLARSFQWVLTPSGRLDGHFEDGNDGTAQIPLSWAMIPDIRDVPAGTPIQFDLAAYLTEPSPPISVITVLSGSLPTGWSLASNGILSYSGAGVGSAAIRLRATRSAVTSDSFAFVVESVASATADTVAPTIPLSLTATSGASGITVGWHASSDPKSGVQASGGMQDYLLARDGNGIATIPSLPGISPQLTGADVGTVLTAGSTTQSGNDYSVIANGDGIGGVGEGGHFAYWQLTGDFELSFKVHGVTGGVSSLTNILAIMRESLAPGARMFALRVNGTSVRVRSRPTADVTTVGLGTQINGPTWPLWLRLQRVGDTLSASYSIDGNTFASVYSGTFTATASVYVGVFAGTGGTGSPITADIREVTIQNLPNLSYLDTISDGASHSYTVRSRDAANNASAASAAVSATAPVGADITPPTVPTGLTGSGTSSSTVSWSWNASTDNQSGIRGYIPMLATTSGGTFVDQPEQTGLTFSVSGLSPTTARYLKVRAVDGVGNQSAATPEVVATSQAAPPTDTTAPTVPTNNAASGISTTQIQITSSGSTDTQSGVAGYKLFVSTALAGPFTLANSVVNGVIQLITSFPYNHTVGSPATTRYYQLSAIDAAGNETARTATFQGTTLTAPGALAFFDDFETTPVGSGPTAAKWNTSVDAALPGEATQVIVGNYAPQGSRSIYRTLTWSAATIGNPPEHTHRVETASIWQSALLSDCWYGVTIRPETLPSDPQQNLLFQMHHQNVAGQIVTQVPFAMLVESDRWKFWVIHCEDIFGADAQPNRKTTNYGIGSVTTDDNGPIDSALWTLDHNGPTRFVVHIKWDHRGSTVPLPNNTGLVEIWKNGTQYFRKAGPVGYGNPNGAGCNFKHGFYKSRQRTVDPGAGRRFISAWWDDVRIYVGANGYSQVA